MKTSHPHRTQQQGSALLLTIVIVGLIGLILVAYLTLVNSQNVAVMRSQAWNSSMPVIEAGVEDALAHINAHGTTNLECDGWTRVDTTYTMTRYIGDSFYVSTITNYVQGASNNIPLIESRAYVVLPQVLASSGQGPLLADASTPAQSVNYLGRGVRVSTGRDRIFVKGIVARDNLDMNGNGARIDSFDSSDPAWSTNGLYNPNRWRDRGDVAVNGSILNGGSVTLGNGNIFGHVSTGAGGTISLGPNGAIGSAAWQAAHTGIQPDWSSSDMNVSFPDINFPYAGGWTPSGDWITNVVSTTIVTNTGSTSTTIGYPSSPGGPVTTNYPVTSHMYPTNSPGPVTFNVTINTTPSSTLAASGYPTAGTYLGPVTSNNITTGNPDYRGWYYDYNYITGYSTNWIYPTFTYISTTTYQTNHTTTRTYYDYVLDGGDYTLTSLNGSIYVRHTSRLTVSSSLSLNGITIKPGKRLDLFSNASTTSLAGNDTANSDGKATSFYIWGTSNVTSLVLDGNAGLTAAYYAPNAVLTVNGGGSNPADMSGAAIVKSVSLNGHFNFHYDEALAKLGPDRGWYVTLWNELKPESIPKASVNEYGQVVFTPRTTTTTTGGTQTH